MTKRCLPLISGLLILIFSACSPQAVITPDLAPAGDVVVPATQTPRVTSPPAIETAASPTQEIVPLGLKPQDLKGLSLRFWHPWTQENARAIQALVERFNQENAYGILVEATPYSGDLYQDLRTGIGGGSLPHVAAAANFQLQSWDRDGNIIVDLGSYLDDPEWGLSASEISDYVPFIWAQDVYQGKHLGLPVYRTAALIFYNQSWAQELGFDSPPATPEAFKEQACAAAAASGVSVDHPGVGGWIAANDPASLMSWVLAFEAEPLDQQVDVYEFNTPQAAAAFDFIKGLFKSGCAWVPEDPYPNAEFASRQGLFYSSSLGGLLDQEAAFEDEQNSDQWVVLPYPGPSGDGVINLYGPAYAILKATPAEQLAAWVFIHWLAQPENQVSLAEASGFLPTRHAGYDLLGTSDGKHPRWSAAWDLVSYSRSEPVFGAWGVARWALGDAFEALINPDFTRQEIPLLLEDLDALLAEISANR
ncbi:MAG: extracellular solute-binding protein [Anaerolineales bacterium]|nr:extracellular solute-binding protein [Anaerolineales bacterium]